MRIAVGQLWQETNTLNPTPTTRADFEAFGVLHGPELVERMAETNELGGFIHSLRAWPEKPEIVGLVRLPAWPGGTATADCFAWLCDELIGALRQALPVDGVLLALHGSLAADGAPDVEGEILEAYRSLIGPRVPLVATLDLHANVTERMVRAADALVLYHTIPHIDVVETGERGAAVLRRILDGTRPVTAFQKLPLVAPVERANAHDRASVSFAIREALQLWERDPRVLSAGLATVQPWLDIPDLGSAVVVVTDCDADLARDRCAGMASWVWDHRRDYLSELPSVEEGVRMAFGEPEGLVVLGDGADATTSGSPGDSNHILREMLKYNWPRPALVPLVNPELVAEAAQRGVGTEFHAMLGGKRDPHSAPLPAVVRVESLFDARFVMTGHLARNLPIDMGPSAALRIGNVHVVVTSRSGPHFSPQLFQSAGLEPFAAQLLVAKSPCGFRAAYQGRAKRMLVVRSTGCAPSDFWQYAFRNIPRPLWPWDEITEWTPDPLVVTRDRSTAFS
ncbi:MAG TPA: M81 family metallopeptidase [Gemmataceae bacterium]|nr:M81 family metallopeptidase [Gemmataceae bacterium]